MDKINELKEIIIDLKMSLIRANIPQGHCPYAYYHPSTKRDTCGDGITCSECKEIFMQDIKEDIRQEVARL